MNRNEINIGLLSTAKDFGLVEETLHSMGLDAATTEVTAIITAGNEEGRGKNVFADRTLAALNAAGVTQVQEVDVAGQDEEEVREQIASSHADGSRSQLIVVTGGDKHYLSKQLRLSNADKVITEQVKTDGTPILTISAGTVLMGRSLEVASDSLLTRQRGLAIVPATIVCHFNPGREERVNRDLARGRSKARTIWGLSDEQSLVGNGEVFQVVGKGDLTVLTKLPLQTDHQKTSTRLVTLR